jgi:dTDP-4-dehydrorhamnose reductase
MNKKNIRVLVLGASGMLGHAVLRVFSKDENYDLLGTFRGKDKPSPLLIGDRINTVGGVDLDEDKVLVKIFEKFMPDLVINCVGLVKQLSEANDPEVAIPINSILPHRLAKICKNTNARLIHISTDCVFSGRKGMYTELDPSDANDIYGKSKFLGELDYPNTITLRTSIIGHGLHGNKSLIDWFLSQSGLIKGYRNAIFSGLPTVELAGVIKEYVVPNAALSGIFQVSVDPISKFDLLKLVATEYQKKIEIIPDDSLKIDRSLDSSKFRLATGFKAKSWPQLIAEMRAFG